MTFEEAATQAAKAVANAPFNMTVQRFHQYIASLVVKNGDNDYSPMTVDEWRKSPDKPHVVITIASGDSFGG